MPATRLSVLLFALLIITSAARAQTRPTSGHVLPGHIRKAVEPHKTALARALRDGDRGAVRARCREIASLLGSYAGVPEDAPRYFHPIEGETPSRAAVVDLWRHIVDHDRPSFSWQVNPENDPRKFTSGMRTAGRPAIAFAGMLRVADEMGLEKEEIASYRHHLRAAADSILAVQRPDGCIPFPDLRGRHRLFGPMIEKQVKKHPWLLKDGWIVDDAGGGELKYDNGICGVALVEAYETLGDEKYIDGARRILAWGADRPLCINWNYNAFLVWFQARFARVTSDANALKQAVHGLELGVLPGQMENGRWFDQHNAKLVYHGILLRALLEVRLALVEKHPLRSKLETALRRGLTNAAEEIILYGASSNSTSTEVLARGLSELRHDEKWQWALDINVNAGLQAPFSRGAPNVGWYLSEYIAYRCRRK